MPEIPAGYSKSVTEGAPVKTCLKTLGVCLATFTAATSGVASASNSPERAHVAGVGAMGTPTTYWASWTTPDSFVDGNASNGRADHATGQITMPDGSTVYLGFSGEVLTFPYDSPSAFGVSGNTYWSNRGFSGSGAVYISANVASLPTNGDRLGVDGRYIPAQSLSFYSDSARTTPVNVSNIVMNLYSVGGVTADILGQWDFANDFVILKDNGPTNSSGAYGFTRTEIAGTPTKYSLTGKEGAGQIQFPGTYNNISWSIEEPEFFATWNIGVTSYAAPGASLTASFDSQGGSAISSVTTTSGGTLSDPGTPTRDGYTFDGWYTSSTDGTKVTFPYAHGEGTDFTLFAQWSVAASTTTSTSPTSPTSPGTTGRPGSDSGATGSSDSTGDSSSEELPVTGAASQVLVALLALAMLVGGAMVARRDRARKGWA